MGVTQPLVPFSKSGLQNNELIQLAICGLFPADESLSAGESIEPALCRSGFEARILGCSASTAFLRQTSKCLLTVKRKDLTS